MPEAWSNQLISLIVLAAQQSGFSGFFAYSPAPGAGNLKVSIAAVTGTDQFGNHYLANVSTYGANFAASLAGGFVQFYAGSLATGWSPIGSIQSDALGDIFLLPVAGRSVSTNSNTLDDGAGNMTVAGALTVIGTASINGSTSTGVGDNGGVTSGPSGTVSAFPAAGPNHTHNETHHHPL